MPANQKINKAMILYAGGLGFRELADVSYNFEPVVRQHMNISINEDWILDTPSLQTRIQRLSYGYSGVLPSGIEGATLEPKPKP